MNDNEKKNVTPHELQKIRDEEIYKVRKLQLLINELKTMDCKKINLPNLQQIEKAIKIAKIGNYLHLNGKQDISVLNVSDVCSVILSYTERKALREQVSINLKNKVKTILAFGQKLYSELPELFNESEDLCSRIVDLEKERAANLAKIIELKARKCHLSKLAVELKLGPYLGYELELLMSQVNESQMKANILRRYFINELLSRSEHGLKAIQEVETYIKDNVQE